jgi:hypothetical protein
LVLEVAKTAISIENKMLNYAIQYGCQCDLLKNALGGFDEEMSMKCNKNTSNSPSFQFLNKIKSNSFNLLGQNNGHKRRTEFDEPQIDSMLLPSHDGEGYFCGRKLTALMIHKVQVI